MGTEVKARGLTSNQLKLLAIIAMVVDHCTIAFVPYSSWAYGPLRFVGRLTAPIMCYFIAEGYYHTSNLKKYMTRLFVMAVVSHVPHNLCMGFSVLEFWQATDVLFSLLLGLIALSAYNAKDMPVLLRLAVIGCCCILAYPADWNYIAVLMILGFGIFHRSKNMKSVSHAVVGSLHCLQAVFTNAYVTPLMRTGIFVSIPILRLYNGQRGRKSKFIQWGFYIFYPAHLLAIYLLKLALK